MISRFFVIILFLNLCVSGSVKAQGEKEFIKQRIDQLASPGFHGRGYVMNGGNIAAQYIADEFKRDAFCRAILNKLVEFSFERIFNQKFDFYATIF